jgi:hypothetical protein
VDITKSSTTAVMSQSPSQHGMMLPPAASTPSPPPPTGAGGVLYPLTTSTSASGLSSLAGIIHSAPGGHHHTSVPPSPDHTLPEGDEAVQATNDDASICKRSAVHMGYWADPFLQYFMRGPVIRKPPEINRGYYARSHGVYRLILKTLEKIATSDVVSERGRQYERRFYDVEQDLIGICVVCCSAGVYSEGWSRRRKQKPE